MTRDRARSAQALVRWLVVATLLTPVMPLYAAPVTPAALRVVVDPGHGGAYTGASYGGITEKTLNLQIARRLVAELRRRGIDARLTRTADRKVYGGGGLNTWLWDDEADAYVYKRWPTEDATDRLRLDLQARCDRANALGGELFVSVHCNAAGSSARGIEVWHAPNDPLGESFATDVLGGLIGRTGAVNRGVHDANFYVTRWSNVPAVLVECGFMSNSGELSRLRSAGYQERLADGIADGIQRQASRPVAEPWTRVAGANRWETAARIVRVSHPGGADTVVLASGEDFADSLVAGPLARSLDAPVLATGRSVLPGVIAAELGRLSPSRLVIVGGEHAVSAGVAGAAARAAGVAPSAVIRIAGANRYDVSLRVAQMVRSAETTGVVVAAGQSWPDAMSISASASERGEPILLCPPTGLTPGQVGFIESLGESRTVTVVGGAAVVPHAALRGLTYRRLAGFNRYETNWQILSARYTQEQRLASFYASGEKFNDALVVGPYAAVRSAPVMLVGKAGVPAATRSWFYERREETATPTMVGGPAAVSAYMAPAYEKWMMRSR